MRGRIIQAVLTCLEKDGYAGTTVSRIIEVAGVSRGAPLHHFASKAAMIAAAGLRRFHAGVTAPLDLNAKASLSI